MRVLSDVRHLDVEPGSTTAVVLDVLNTGQVIDGVTTRVIGLAEENVAATPALLPLFPDASGQVTVALAVPTAHPAGLHPLTVEVISHGARHPSQYLDLELAVAAKPAMRIMRRPRVARARRTGRFVLELTNDGNVPLDVSLTAVDVDRSTTTTFAPERLRLEAGTVAPVLCSVRGPRMISGPDTDRIVTIEALARSVFADADTEETLPRQTTVQLRQKPLISRGLMTALILMSIVALWAAAFLLGLGKVFAQDPMVKDAPASFFAGDVVGGSGAAGGHGRAALAAAPAGALAKNGQVPLGTGGTIDGTVTALTDTQPVGRILVQAWRQGRQGPVLVSSAATQSDGTYSLAGLFPTTYRLEFSAQGFHTVWYPAQHSFAAAQSVNAVSQATTSGVNAVISGDPASISGQIDAGTATGTEPTTTVQARSLEGALTSKPVKTTTTDSAGKYTLTGLPAPADYQLTFTTGGYQPSTVVVIVNGGDQRLEPTVVLGAGTGSIAGTVLTGSTPLGGATVSTTLNGSPLTVVTPTTGQVGAFTLANLTTPATYVLTFSAPGHGSSTTIVELKAGASQSGVVANLSTGTGSVTGQVTTSGGTGLGGVTVTVGGTAAATSTAAPSTTTLTGGNGAGDFYLDGLTAPGSYTLTFSETGYLTTSQAVTLTQNGAAPVVNVVLQSDSGSISGYALGPNGSPYAGASITAGNGTTTYTSTSDSGDGFYNITGLPPGSYSVTVSASGLQQQTALLTVTAGSVTSQNLKLAN